MNYQSRSTAFNPYDRQLEPSSYIRLLHASPDAPNVDIYANGTIIARNISYRSFTEYFPVIPGSYNIRVFPTGQTLTPVLASNVTLSPETITTIAVTGRFSALSLLPVPDPILFFTPGSAYVRFVHLSPNTSSVDITLPDGRSLFRDIEYRELTGYIPLSPAVYTINARLAGTQQIILTVPNIRLLPNRFYSIYLVGLAGGNPPLQVLIPLDGNTYIKFRQPVY